MKQRISKFKANVKISKKTLVFLVGLAIIGLILGSIYTVILKDGDKSLVKDYMGEFLSNIKNNKVNYLNIYLNNTILSFLFIVVIWLFGISVIGIPVILFMYFTKAFVMGFTISSFILNYKIKGILLSFIYVVPHGILTFLVYIILMNYAITLSKKLTQTFIKKKEINFRGIMQKYVLILGVCLISMLVLNLYEVFIVPKLMMVFI
jgi:Uncharacterized membrane protein